jgi:hypothetical protein
MVAVLDPPGCSLGVQPTLVGKEGAAAEEGVVQQVVQQGGHRWVVIRVVLRADVFDGEDRVGGDARPLRHLRARNSRKMTSYSCICMA